MYGARKWFVNVVQISIEEKIIQLTKVRHMLMHVITEKVILKVVNMNMVTSSVKLKKYKNGN